ncbi:divalent metal cation transporter [Candidatus Falkowbacteria bacterium]|nr:divalent metal cation transporter [Candidatus Falkowbacteria bacterium]
MAEWVKKILKRLGPGFVTGASDDDPSGIGTYASAGARFGFSSLWTPFFTFPLMAAVQEICARIGMVSGRGLAGVIRQHFSKTLLYTCVSLLVIANTLNIGVDIGAMASALQLLAPLPFTLFAITVTIVIIILEVAVPYRKYVTVLKFLALFLLAYWATGLFIEQDWWTVAKSVVWPQIHWSADFLFILVAIFGTTITPYLFFWQASEEVEEEELLGRRFIKSRQGASAHEIHEMRWDVFSGMLFSNITMFFIILTAAISLHASGVTNIETAQQAAQALRPLAGDHAYWLFAVGIVGTAMLAIPVLAGSASYGLSEALKFRGSLSLNFKQAHGFYGIIIISTLIGLLINFVGINPIKALVYMAVLNGIIAVPLLFVIMIMSNSQKIMGEFKNGALANTLGWLTTAVMTVSVLVLLWSFIK